MADRIKANGEAGNAIQGFIAFRDSALEKWERLWLV